MEPPFDIYGGWALQAAPQIEWKQLLNPCAAPGAGCIFSSGALVIYPVSFLTPKKNCFADVYGKTMYQKCAPVLSIIKAG